MQMRRGKVINLALQGGGSHGAFTWGVLDRLLQEEWLSFEGISGASAGAMNAVAMAHGLVSGGREGARRALAAFWESVAGHMPLDPWRAGLAGEPELPADGEPSPLLNSLLALSRYFSPYELNPLRLNPLRDILAEQIDFARLREQRDLKLFVAATQASTGMLRLFETPELSLDVLLASACLPSLHHAVEIDGQAYWDGGYSANPAVFPLLCRCQARDVVVVLLHPLTRPALPRTAREILNRVAELGFSAPFLREMQTLTHAKREADQALFPTSRLERRLRAVHFHMIEAQDLMAQLSTASKLNAHRPFLLFLREQGRQRADAWLERHRASLTVRSSVNLDEVFAGA